MLFIADEVITGFGRTGRWFALGHWGVQPDLMSFAKGVTSGYLPLGGVIVSKRVHQAMEDAPMDERFMHAATYSGHPVCCAVGLRNIDIIEQDGLPERAAVMGRKLLAGLETLRSLPVVGDVRGLGMMCAVELVEDQATRKPAIGLGGRVVAEAMKRGLIIRQRGGGGTPVSGDSLMTAPPLMTPEATLDRIVSIIGEFDSGRTVAGHFRVTGQPAPVATVAVGITREGRPPCSFIVPTPLHQVRVDTPDPVFAEKLLEQFGGATGELSAALTYFTQSFHTEDQGIRDMLQNIATEEFGHLEMVALMIEQHTKRAKQGAQEKAFNSTLFAVRGYGPHLVDSRVRPGIRVM